MHRRVLCEITHCCSLPSGAPARQTDYVTKPPTRTSSAGRGRGAGVRSSPPARSGGTMSTRFRRCRFLVVIGLVALVGSACASVKGLYTGPVTVTTGVYRLGPFNLAAMDQPGSESEAVQGGVPRPPGNIGIKAMTFDLVDAAGNPVPRMDAHLHHVLLMNHAHTSPICSGEEERFAGAGAERTPLKLWGSYAYMVGSTDRWDALWHIMNMSESAQTVYIQYTVDYVAATDPSAARPVTPFFMDVTGCGTNAEFNVPGTGGA